MTKLKALIGLFLLCLNACSCDDSPKQVNDLIAALTPLPRLPSDLADELRRLKALIDAHADNKKPHIQLARDTFVASYLDGVLIAKAAGRSHGKLVELFKAFDVLKLSIVNAIDFNAGRGYWSGKCSG